MRVHAQNYDLDPSFLAAVIEQESKFRADAKSSAGAIGLMQLQPATAKGIAIRTGGSKFVLSDLYDPELNVRYGSWYLHHLMVKYGDERLALAAYNAGQQNVDRWRAAGEDVQFPETRAYVSKVERLKKIYRRAYASELGYYGAAAVAVGAARRLGRRRLRRRRRGQRARAHAVPRVQHREALGERRGVAALVGDARRSAGRRRSRATSCRSCPRAGTDSLPGIDVYCWLPKRGAFS